jgi:hypothetical protein
MEMEWKDTMQKEDGQIIRILNYVIFKNMYFILLKGLFSRI